MGGSAARMIVHATIQKRLSSQFSLDVTLTAPPGITILFGASGSGKSTVLRCLAGLMRPENGRIVVGERVLFDAGAGVNVPVPERNIGYVFQQLALFPHMSIRQNIEYGLHRLPAGERRLRTARIAESFHIPHVLERRPAHVSGGERQRAALARALVTDPSLLLLDEPLSALDHAIQSHIMNDLRRWNEERRSAIVYVTHAHREVFALGERAVVLDRGRILASGSPHEVLDHPAHPLLASLAGFENVFEAVVMERRERAGTMQCRLNGSGVEIEVPLTEDALGETIRVAIRAGDILVANQQPKGLSARNVLTGTLTSLAAQGPTMVAAVDAGVRFIVHLTPGGVDSLGVKAGDRLWLVIKTYSCRIIAE
jgi:molybdate transport system ATP-binding protein